MTTFYVDANGNYLGGFDGALPPEGAIQVPNPPNDGRDKWVNDAWVPSEESRVAGIKEQIEWIERREIMPRKTREIQIQIMLFFAQQQGLTHDQLYVVNPAYKGMVDIDNQIKALRAQL